MMNIKVLAIFALFLTACSSKAPVPKPFGHVRIDLPEHNYVQFAEDYPYTFEFPAYGTMRQRPDYWCTVEMKDFKSDIHLTYKPLDGDLFKYLEESRDLVYNHTSKADGIQERLFMNPDRRVYGVMYEISGDAASQLQFFITDSTQHFLRGALYFRATPNYDSIRPVFEHLRDDVIHLMETTEWNQPS